MQSGLMSKARQTSRMVLPPVMGLITEMHYAYGISGFLGQIVENLVTSAKEPYVHNLGRVMLRMGI